MSVNGWLNKEGVAHIYSRILLIHKKNETLTFATTGMNPKSTMLRKTSQMEKARTIQLHSCESNTWSNTESNTWTKKTIKQTQDTVTVWWLPWGGGGGWRGSRGQINGDRRGPDLGWWAHHAICRRCSVKLYTGNLYNVTNQCHPNKSKLKRKAVKEAYGLKVCYRCHPMWHIKRTESKPSPFNGSILLSLRKYLALEDSPS